MRVSAITFDLDGTLLDTVEDIADAMNAVLTERGAPTHSLDSYKLFVGEGMEVLARRALPAGADEQAVAATMEAMRLRYGARWDVKSRPYGGIAELLDALVARDVAMLVLSNKPEELTRAAVARLLARWTFLAVRGARAGVPKKPDPVSMLALIEEHHLDAATTLYVGDTSIDMLTAKAAGLRAVGVAWGFREEEELRASGADEIIHHPSELLSLL